MQKAVCLLVLSAMLPGCGKPESTTGPPPGTGPANPNQFSQMQLELFISDELKLSSLQMSTSGDGNYVAQGTGSDGTFYDIKINQNDEGATYTWKTSSDDGSGSFDRMSK